MDSELKADGCPFCGSTNISDGEMLTEKDDGSRVTQSQCRGCGAFGPEAVTDGPHYGDVRAITAWNRRARPTPAPGALPELKDRLWDSQWVNIVNDPLVMNAESREDAVARAVKLTEQKMAENFRAYGQQCRAGVEWLPIETAPKGEPEAYRSGPRILGVVISDSGWSSYNIVSWSWHKNLRTGSWKSQNGIWEPTHWMPLPAPPALQSAFADDEGVNRED